MMLKMQVTHFYLLAAVFSSSVNLNDGHGLGIHQLQGFDPPSTPNIREITGPFQLDLTMRCDDPEPETYQPIFLFRNPNPPGGIEDYRTIITLFQSFNGTGLEFTVHNSTDVSILVIPDGTIVAGEVASYSMGVKADGTLWFQKKGGAFHSMPGYIPENFERPEKFLGDFPCPGCHQLRGVILDLSIRNLDEPFHPRMYELRNIPSQIHPSGFVVSFHARVDDLTQPSYIFCIADKSPHSNHVSFEIINTTGAGEFSMRLADDSVASVLVDNAVMANVTSLWHLTYDPSGIMSIDRDGTVLGTTTVASSAPAQVFRPSVGFGQGCSGAASGPLDGVVLGLRVDLFVSS